jgi:Ran-binding protein 1
VVTGEEAEEELAKFRSKLYRWRNKEWKERGIGELRFLKHKSHGKIRVLMRQEKTLKIVANFYGYYNSKSF